MDGAQANLLPGALPDEVRQERRNRFMEVQAEISAEKLRAKIGTTMDVMVDEYDDEAGLAIGRTKADSPEIDGKCYVETLTPYQPGDIVKVRITNSEEYDLVGTPEDELKA